LLLTLAVIDDVGAIVVIAVFYASGFSAWGLLVVAIGIAAVIGMQKVGVRSPWAYVVPATVVWVGAYRTGIHPTIAGVVIGLLTPVRAWLGIGRFFDRAKTTVARIENTDMEDEKAMLPELDKLNAARREAVSPVETLQHALHGWVAFGIMPLFAFANAGVEIGRGGFEGAGLRVFCGVVIGLVLGKPLGIFLVSWLSVRMRIAKLPTGIQWRHVAIIGTVAGIGFTMAIFVAQLAFATGALLEGAKLAILSSSALAAIFALLAGRFFLSAAHHAEAARSEAEAESSTDQ
jgi:Na+:H+ antiporter, NhaA family